MKIWDSDVQPFWYHGWPHLYNKWVTNQVLVSYQLTNQKEEGFEALDPQYQLYDAVTVCIKDPESE